MRFARVFWMVAVVVFVPSLAAAQVTATLSGEVVDSAGAVIPGRHA